VPSTTTATEDKDSLSRLTVGQSLIACLKASSSDTKGVHSQLPRLRQAKDSKEPRGQPLDPVPEIGELDSPSNPKRVLQTSRATELGLLIFGRALRQLANLG
jgi:hypothetical protein